MDEKQWEYRNIFGLAFEGRELPKGYDRWGMRAVRPDFTSKYDYRWPFPGSVAKAPGPLIRENKGGCPDDIGDGICLATGWKGIRSGGIPLITLLVCAYKDADVLGTDESDEKLRVAACKVIEVIDGFKFVATNGASANLRSADLRSANLRSADLRSANLRSADLRSANLGSADLRSANLRSADLRSADLRSANLGSANLRYADLRSANLRYANLGSANLGSANLGYANLGSANLGYADLGSADLAGAYVNDYTAGIPDGWVNQNGILVRASAVAA